MFRRYLAVGSTYGCVAIWKFVGEYEPVVVERDTAETTENAPNGKKVSLGQHLELLTGTYYNYGVRA